MMQDRSFKECYSYLRMTRALVDGFIDEEWTKLIDWEHPKTRRLDPRHVVKGLIERQSDLTWLLGWKGPETGSFCLTMEAQSTVDPTMPFRSHAYAALTLDGVVRFEGLPVPTGVVVSIVLYTGKRPWSPERAMEKVTVSMAGLEDWQPRFRYILIDARRRAWDKLDEWNPAQTLFQLLVTDIEEWPTIMARAAKELSALEDQPLLAAMNEAAIVALCTEHPELAEPDKPATEGEWKMLIQRVAECKAETLQQGIQQGIQEGIQEGTRKMLVNQARHRFGEAAAKDLDDRLTECNGNGTLDKVSLMILDCDATEDFRRRVRAI